jgi:hypothetical protein
MPQAVDSYRVAFGFEELVDEPRWPLVQRASCSKVPPHQQQHPMAACVCDQAFGVERDRSVTWRGRIPKRSTEDRCRFPIVERFWCGP